MRPPTRTGLAAPLPAKRWKAAVRSVVGIVRSSDPSVTEVTAEVTAPMDDVAEAAELHGLEGWVREAVGPGNARLDRAVHAALGRHQRALSDLDLAATALDGAGIGFLVVKGPALVAVCYPSASRRSYVDLDLLILPEHLPAAVPALERAGFTLVDSNWPMMTRSHAFELRLEGPSGGALDLHWALTGASSGVYSPPVADLLERSVEIELDGRSVRTLGPSDTVAHVAVHAAGSGGHRLIWMTDLALATTRALGATTEQELIRVIDLWRARPAVSLMAARASRTIGMSPPSRLSSLLKPGPWAALVWMADRMSPPELTGTSGSISRLVARSCRSSSGDSLRAASSRSVEWARGDRLGPLAPADLLDPTNPDSALFPAGGRAGAQAFFAHIADEAQSSRSDSAAAPTAGLP